MEKVGKDIKQEGYAPGDVDERLGAVASIPKKDQEDAKARLLAKAKAKREKMKKEELNTVEMYDAFLDEKSSVALRKEKEAADKKPSGYRPNLADVYGANRRNSKPLKKEEIELEELDEAKKKCKSGYTYDKKKKKCVKKKKKSSSSKKSSPTYVYIGRPRGFYGGSVHHHHDDDGDKGESNGNGGNGGDGGNGGGGDAGGGGGGE